ATSSTAALCDKSVTGFDNGRRSLLRWRTDVLHPTTERCPTMRRLLLLLAAVAIVPLASAWTWPADGPVLRPFSYDPQVPKDPGQHRGIDVAGPAGALGRA